MAKTKKESAWSIVSKAREKAGISRNARIKRGEGKRGGKIKKEVPSD